MSGNDAGLELRELKTIAELKQAEVLQVEVWGEDDKPDNSDIMLAIQHVGGLVAGAFKDGRMLGFLFAFPSSQSGVQHAHRLAVHPDSRGLGLGERLKWFQRDWCLAHDIALVRWTYDPLRRVNAGLNIAKLGATAGTYYDDYYGEMEGINAGVPSDRLLVEWHLNAPEVQSRQRNPRVAPTPELSASNRVVIPADFDHLLVSNLKEAISERLRVRAELNSVFADGFRITGFDVKACEYLLTKV